ncbi:MAG: DUF2188 domain-containing protein [Cyclobacteriaceae bacterium]|nr:DUF2188 domain-containing protein [Cyclobacteriaceae bacterium SS2]
MTRKVYHVTPAPGGWKGKAQGGAKSSVTGSTKSSVVSKTIDIAKGQGKSQVIIHGRDGRIQEERTYPRSSDPRRTKG